jgi:hypothetical protein
VVIALPDLFVCHTWQLKSNEIITKKAWQILPDSLACSLLSGYEKNQGAVNRKTKEERRS